MDDKQVILFSPTDLSIIYKKMSTEIVLWQLSYYTHCQPETLKLARGSIALDLILFCFGLLLYVLINSYGHVSHLTTLFSW